MSFLRRSSHDGVSTDTGAVHLYRGSDGALISVLTGGGLRDRVGRGGIVVLPSGKFLVLSYQGDNGAVGSVQVLSDGDFVVRTTT